MEKRKIISEVLQKIQSRLEQLKELVEKTKAQELEDILDYHFEEFGTNIEANFNFMEMIVTRMEHGSDSDSSDISKLSNEELEKYFEEHWDVLVFP